MRKHLYNKPRPHIQPNYISDTFGTIFRSLVLNGKKEAALSICLSSDGRRRVCPSVGCHISRLKLSYMCEPKWSGREYGTPCTMIVSLFHDKQDWNMFSVLESFSRKPKLNCRQTVSGNNSFFKTQSWLFERFCAFSNMKPNSQSGGTIKFLLL